MLNDPEKAAASLRKLIGPKSVVEVWPRTAGAECRLLVAIDPRTTYAVFDVPGEWRGFKVQRTYWAEPAS